MSSFARFVQRFFFPHGLPFSMGFTEDLSSSAQNLSGGPPVISSAPAPSGTQVIIGPGVNAGANSVEFVAGGVDATPESGVVDIFGCDSLKNWTSGRQSAAIIGQYILSVIITPSKADNPIASLSGYVAIMAEKPAGTGYNYPSTVEKLAIVPGAIAVQVGTGMQFTGVLPDVPNLQTDALINQTSGRNPFLVYAFNKTNIKDATITVKNRVVLSGMSVPSSFYK